MFEFSDTHFGIDNDFEVLYGTAIHAFITSTRYEELKNMKNPPTEYVMIEAMPMTTGFELVQGKMKPIVK